MIQQWTHKKLAAHKFPPARFLVQPLIPAHGLTIIGGVAKLGKSLLCLQLTQAVALGVPFLGMPTSQGRVLYIVAEDGPARIQDRLKRQQAPADLDAIYYCPKPGELSLESDQARRHIENSLEEHHPAALIIDTLAATKTSMTDENDAGHMADLCNLLRGMAQKAQTAIIITHHHGKSHQGSPLSDLRGSSAIAAAADCIIGLYKDDSIYTLKAEGRDIEETSISLRLDKEITLAWQLAQPGPNGLATDPSIIEALMTNGGYGTANDLAGILGKSRSTLASKLFTMRQAGLLDSRKEGSKIVYMLKAQI